MLQQEMRDEVFKQAEDDRKKLEGKEDELSGNLSLNYLRIMADMAGIQNEG